MIKQSIHKKVFFYNKNFVQIVNTKIQPNCRIAPFVNIFDSFIGKNCSIGAFTEIGGSHVGDYCKIQSYCLLCRGVCIGNRVFIGPAVIFTNDKYPKAVGDWKILSTIVEDEVSIGGGSIILPGIRIGIGAVIGAGSVVTKDVEAGITVFGNPAKRKKL